MSDDTAEDVQRPILGIDLGVTSITMAAFEDDGRPRVVPNEDGEDATDACIHIYEEDGVVVGSEARKMAAIEPETVFEDVSWRLGEAEWKPELHGRTWTAQELLGLLLRKLREDASNLRGAAISKAVVAVPAWYDSARRHAAVEAATIGGLEVLSLVNQPLCAALGVRADRIEGNGPVVVFDLGGRDLEVTVLDKQGDQLTVRASQVRYDLCTRAFELRLREYLVEQYRAESDGETAHEDQILAQQVVDAAHAALSHLAHREQTAVRIAHGGVAAKITIDRRTFGVRTATLLSAAVGMVDQVLAECGYKPKDTVACVAVGRGSRLPTVQGALRERFRNRLLLPSDPDQCIARGAALLAVLRHDKSHPGLAVLDSTRTGDAPLPAPHDHTIPDPEEDDAEHEDLSDSGRHRAAFGLADGGHGGLSARDATTNDLGLIALDRDRRERVVKLIPHGTPVPCEVKGRFTYAYNGMTGVRVEVTEGRGSRRSDVQVIGVVELRDLPPRPIGTPIEIVYAYGVDQILKVQVVDVDTGRRRDVDLTFRGGMTASEVKDAASHADGVHFE